jgi:hypothetical protein
MTKLTKSESGKLGAAAWQKVAEQNRLLRIEEYNKNPHICSQCSAALDYSSRHNKFCGHSCSASAAKGKDDIEWNCLSCGKTHKCRPHKVKIYCNLQCQQGYAYSIRIQNWKNGVPIESIGTPIWIKRYILEKQDNKCEKCGIKDWNNKPITFELEHKDGNSEHNLEGNLCCLCPNCHSQTPTYKGRNKGNGRHSRRERYKEGKSF